MKRETEVYVFHKRSEVYVFRAHDRLEAKKLLEEEAGKGSSRFFSCDGPLNLESEGFLLHAEIC